MPGSPTICWTLVINDHRAWVFERAGPRGRLVPVFSCGNPAAALGLRPHDPRARQRSVTGWASSLGEHLRLAHSAGHYDQLELIAPAPLVALIEAATRGHVDRVLATRIDSTDEATVRAAATRLTRRLVIDPA